MLPAVVRPVVASIHSPSCAAGRHQPLRRLMQPADPGVVEALPLRPHLIQTPCQTLDGGKRLHQRPVRSATTLGLLQHHLCDPDAVG